MSQLRHLALLVLALAAGGCSGTQSRRVEAPSAEAPPPRASTQPQTLAAARAGFKTGIATEGEAGGEPPAEPPKTTGLRRIKYPAASGELWAYVSEDPGDGRKHPAVVWAAGGFDFSVGESFFVRGAEENDQSAVRLRDEGIVVMYPSYRGAHDNPGHPEFLYGEVDDYLAAVRHVKQLPYVDSERVYLGGHSTGGVIVLLAAAMSDDFRAAFSFGPIDDVQNYGVPPPFDTRAPTAAEEWRLRAPIHFVQDIQRPTLIVEGELGNAQAAFDFRDAAQRTGAPVTVAVLGGMDHFNVLAPFTHLIAKKIRADTGTQPSAALTAVTRDDLAGIEEWLRAEAAP